MLEGRDVQFQLHGAANGVDGVHGKKLIVPMRLLICLATASLFHINSQKIDIESYEEFKKTYKEEPEKY